MNSHVFLGQLEVDFDVPNEVPYVWAVQEL